MNVYLPILGIGAGIVAAIVVGFYLFLSSRREARRQAQAREARP